MSVPLITDRQTLTQAVSAGRQFDWLLFWGHRPPRERNAAVTASVLSQWYVAPFEVDGQRYPTAEHWMMAGKAQLFGDAELEQRILATADPGRAKALGRQVRGFDDTLWTAARFDLVVRGNLAKFGQHPALRRFLLGTGEAILVEASPVDSIWGIGMAAGDPGARDPAQWRGLNLLGFALMQVRQKLRLPASPIARADPLLP